MEGRHGMLPRGLEEAIRRQTEFGRFGQMFPQLPPLDVPDEPLRQLAATMLDDGASGDNLNVPAGYTYLGQFIDHDITLDTSAIGEALNDPKGLVNFRTPRLDLDCVYGGGPGAMPQLYDRRDGRKLLIGRCVAGGGGDPGVKAGLPNDLPRTREGLAVIGDPRNDENLLVAQTHLAIMKFHNKVVDYLDAEGRVPAGQRFEEARRLVRWHYQHIVLFDFLAKLIDMNELQDVLSGGRKYYCFERQSDYAEPYMPVEFSVAAYRLGHSMVREDYSYNRAFNRNAGPATLGFLFNFTGKSGGIVGDLTPDFTDQAAIAKLQQELRLPSLKFPDGTEFPPLFSATLPGDWAIDWHRFYELGQPKKPPAGAKKPDGSPFTENNFLLNHARLLDPYLVPALHKLPREAKRLDSLAFLNLKRGVKMQLPSGQAVAEAMEIAALRPGEIAESGKDGAMAAKLGLHEQTPLWYYILKEAQLRGNRGNRLGPVGSRILAEVFVGLLEGDAESFLRQDSNWKPSLPAANKGSFTMPDLLRFVGDLDPINEASSF
ncbi:heme peroxidase family protein [Siccirubricoccus sp. KC 17139]|uniref:Heme peroxidase family protein n=1 Tax=Siccirubricoccus soli TaxID=2899147 RepID=A0ABT1D0Y8_9PROT|nr:heme peroxidase family protein [Siccirubricoccus soli]MCO6414705.1 heme peroxidase family protein [Siccirubricoccus soli]MCP2680835.1 heme peroxidase family protein [Siccirubricoccus soli]